MTLSSVSCTTVSPREQWPQRALEFSRATVVGSIQSEGIEMLNAPTFHVIGGIIYAMLMVFCPYLDDVGIGACADAIVGPHSIIVKGVGS